MNICIKKIQRLGFKPGTQLNIFCSGCSRSIKVFSDKLDETEIQKFLVNHTGHDCFFGFNDGRKWKIQNDGGKEINEPQRIEPDSLSPIPFKQDVPIEAPREASPQTENGHVDIDNEIVGDNLNEGAFIVSRSLSKSEVWFRDPLYLKAWVWIIENANYRDKKRGDFVYNRGEFFTTHDEFREALKFYRNHKLIKSSLKQSRVILDWFTDNKMIEKTPIERHGSLSSSSPSAHEVQGTRAEARAYIGFKIRVINFDTYQNLANYKGRGKEKSKGRAGAELGHYTNNVINKKIYIEGSNPLRLATLLLKEIQKNKPDFKQPNLQSWAKNIDLMIRRDGRKPERIQQVIEWCQGDSFWKGNILSTSKLRKQFDTLEIQMESPKRSRVTERPRIEYEDFTGAGQR
jgi:hypothetical protein